MKFFKLSIGAFALYVMMFSTSTGIVSCTKPIDTLYVKDTIKIRDTITIRDTIGCNCYNLKDGLVAYYNFKNGNLNDSSGKNNHIAFNNATKTTDRFGNANGAYLFNGTNSYMRVANSPSINPDSSITMMAIVKLNGYYNGLCHGNSIISKVDRDEVNGVMLMRVTDQNCNAPMDSSRQRSYGAYGNNSSSRAAGAGAQTPASSTKLGQWYTLVYTYEAGLSRFYINGKVVESFNYTTTFTPNTLDLYIGAGMNSMFPYWFNGVIDEVRIYNKALCPEAVKQFNDLKQ